MGVLRPESGKSPEKPMKMVKTDQMMARIHPFSIDSLMAAGFFIGFSAAS